MLVHHCQACGKRLQQGRCEPCEAPARTDPLMGMLVVGGLILLCLTLILGS